METPPPPIVTKSGGFGLLVWIVPLVALLIGGYVLKRELADRGPRITIEFKDAAGVAVDHTKLVFKGIVIGAVSNIQLKDDQSGVRVEVELIPGAGPLAREGARFWIHRPEISLKGVRGLDTLLSGVSLMVQPGEGGEATEFTGLDHPPTSSKGAGTEYVLSLPHRHGLDVGTPVAFRGVVVGRVLEYELAPDTRSVLVRIQVDSPHDGMVRENSVFWNASGLDMKMGLFSGLRLRDGGVENILSGSISFATPNKAGRPAAALTVFDLADRVEDEWLKWDPVLVPTPQGSGAPESPHADAGRESSPAATHRR
jgi:paraquat-inducible protein B